MNSIYNMDCIEGMKQLPSGSIDLIITSPPYNLGAKHHTGNNVFNAYNTYIDDMPEQEYQNWQIELLKECHRVLSDGGSMFYNHKNRIRNGSQITPYEWLLKSPLTIKQELVWFNRSQNFDKCRFYPMTERIYWLTKSPHTKLINNINHHDLFDWSPEGTDKEHKRSFPLKMCIDIISCFPNAKNVLDPFMGSGTVAIAAIEKEIEYIGYEVDKEYCDLACKRIEQHISQVRFEL